MGGANPGLLNRSREADELAREERTFGRRVPVNKQKKALKIPPDEP